MNVFGFIRGEFEPDSYIILGASQQMPVSLAVLLHTASLLANMTTANVWRPSRTLVICAWGDSRDGAAYWRAANEQRLHVRTAAYVHVGELDGGDQLASMASYELTGAAEAAALAAIDAYSLDERAVKTMCPAPTSPPCSTFITELPVPIIAVTAIKWRQLVLDGIEKRSASTADDTEQQLPYTAVLYTAEIVRALTGSNPLPVNLTRMCDYMIETLREYRHQVHRHNRAVNVLDTLADHFSLLSSDARRLQEGVLAAANDVIAGGGDVFFVRAVAYNIRMQCAVQCFVTRTSGGTARNVLYKSTDKRESHTTHYETDNGGFAVLPALSRMISAMLHTNMDELIVADELEPESIIIQQCIYCARLCLRDFL
jgi:hypothetical protein